MRIRRSCEILQRRRMTTSLIERPRHSCGRVFGDSSDELRARARLTRSEHAAAHTALPSVLRQPPSGSSRGPHRGPLSPRASNGIAGWSVPRGSREPNDKWYGPWDLGTYQRFLALPHHKRDSDQGLRPPVCAGAAPGLAGRRQQVRATVPTSSVSANRRELHSVQGALAGLSSRSPSRDGRALERPARAHRRRQSCPEPNSDPQPDVRNHHPAVRGVCRSSSAPPREPTARG